MLSSDSSLARGNWGAFYFMLARFSTHFERIDIISPHASEIRFTKVHQNVYLHPSPWGKLWQPFYILKKGREIFEQQHFDLILSHDFGVNYNGIGALLLSFACKVPFVSEVHHIEGYPRAVSLKEWIYRQISKVYFRLVSKRALAFRVVNRKETPAFLERRGVDSSKIRLLPSCYLDLEIYKPKLAEKRYDILFVGRLATNKGLMLLLEALRGIKAILPDVLLGIRGEGALRPKVEEFLHRHGLTSNVTFIPRLQTPQQMAELYNAAKLLVCASTVEGSPRVTIEAMACAIPVISTAVGIMPEVIQSGQNGYIVDWNAADLAQRCLALLQDRTLREELGRAGQASVQKFDAQKLIDNYALSCKQLAEQSEILGQNRQAG